MMKHALTVVAVASLSITQSSPPQTFRATSHAVTLDVSVLDRGRPVPELGISDFQVVDNGEEQSGVKVSRETLPLDISLLLDVSGSVRMRVSDGLIKALTRIRPLIPASDHVDIWPFGTLIFDARADAFVLPWSWAVAGYGTFHADRGTALFDAIVAAALRQPTLGSRRVIIVFSDNEDEASFLPRQVRRSVLARLDAVVQVAAYRFQALSIYRDLTGQSPAFGDSDLLYELADLTGGSLFSLDTTADPTEVVTKALDEFRSRYVVRYEIAAPQSGWHDVRVRVPGKNYQIKARRGYEVR